MSALLLKPNRRQFLSVAGGLAAFGAATGLSTVTSAAALEAATTASVVLHDPRLPLPADVALRIESNGTRLIQISDDPVRMWREDLGAVLRNPSTRLFGLTMWADYLIVRGLAAESRRHTRFEQQHADTGHFTWLIA